MPPRRRPVGDLKSRAGSPPRPAGTTWTSSPTPSARRTGGATTTSPSRSTTRLSQERHPIPDWVVVGAGTGGTSATIERYVRYRRLDTRLCVVDPENSAFFPGWAEDDPAYTCRLRVADRGIGRPRVEPSFIPSVVDAMIRVPDAASIAAARWSSAVTGRLVGASTGTAMWGSLKSSWRRCGPPDVPERGDAAVRRWGALRARTTPTRGSRSRASTWRRTSRRWRSSPRPASGSSPRTDRACPCCRSGGRHAAGVPIRRDRRTRKSLKKSGRRCRIGAEVFVVGVSGRGGAPQTTGDDPRCSTWFP